MRVPLSTYRLQIRESFDLQNVAGVADYIRELGADWVYLSPILTAEHGSDHGYDVTDHSRVDERRGGAAGLKLASASARENGLGVLVDIVPNHVGVASPIQSVWWWDLLTHGRASRFAEAFDVDWDFGGGKVRIPVLGDEAEPEFTIANGELRYYHNRFPLAPGTADDDASPAEVHSRQNYELMNWRRADAELNYRRFFAVNTLAGIRVEIPWVFDESHQEILRWIGEGLADGVRVDHPDGLLDPGGYLDALAAATGGCYVLVEKILEGDEQLPTSWAAAGTTGYDALADIDRVLVDPAGQTALDALDRTLRGTSDVLVWSNLIHETKRGVADGILRSEVLRIERDIIRVSNNATGTALDENLPGPVEGDRGISPTADAIAELLACFPVYRSYLPLGIEHLNEAAELAKNHRPELSGSIEALREILSDPDHPAATRFQQTSGMVMAKGVEDTAFYRFTRLTSLTEVGADPEEFAVTLGQFHSRQQVRQASFPTSMTTLSTHDTKRGEDVRARISVLAEIPDVWASTLRQLREASPVGDGPLESLLWQAIVGSWPASRERLHAYAEKASREADDSTHWTAPNEHFEQRMHALIDSAFDDSGVAAILEDFVTRLEQPGWSNSLAAKVIQLTAPGVPDVYQGSELWETSLVDPDNRREVDFDLRRLHLAAIDGGSLPAIDESGAAKLLVTSRALRLRRDHPDLFFRYAAVAAFGAAAHHVIAFDRGEAVTVATRLPVGLAQRGGWGDTTIRVPAQKFTEVFTGRKFAGGEILISELLERYPVALLAPSRVGK